MKRYQRLFNSYVTERDRRNHVLTMINVDVLLFALKKVFLEGYLLSNAKSRQECI